MKDFCKKLLDVFKKPLWLLCLGLGIVLFASIFANMANTSLYSVSVTEVEWDTYKGEGEDAEYKGNLHALVYRPRKCTADNPCATIVTTHGYLNSKEMQDAPAVELSKRGYVVVALDMYGHGDSTWDAAENGAGLASYLPAMWDAVQEVYSWDFVMKAADGTGMIAVSGHSMGAMAALNAVATDYKTYTANPAEKQKIVAVLAVANTGGTIKSRVEGKVTSGTIAAHYDEFFFAPDNLTGKETGLVRKDWVKTTAGAKFYYGDDSAVASDEIVAGEWNETAYGGAGSVIYTPNEIHPWNHFSTETTGYMIEFYDKAFETQFTLRGITENQGVVAYKDGKAQTWWLKEGFNFVALLGMFLAVVAAVAVFAKLPFFAKVVTPEGEINEVGAPTGARKWLMRGFLVLSCFTTVWVYPMQNLGKTDPFIQALYGLMWGSGILLVILAGVGVLVKALKGEDEKAVALVKEIAVCVVGVFVTSFFAYWMMTRTFFANSKFYNESGTTTVARWVIVAAPLTLVSLAISHAVSGRKDGYTLANYGLKANWKQILMALLIAVLVVTGVYGLTFLIEALLKVDFRIWTYALKPFGKAHFATFLKYLPAFFLFYLVNSISIVANTGADKTWKGTLKAILINALGLVILLGVQYGQWFITGTSKWTLQLPIIYVFAIVPTMILAAWITRKSYAKTGNIWTAVFINTFIFTMMQVANTYITVYSNLGYFQ